MPSKLLSAVCYTLSQQVRRDQPSRLGFAERRRAESTLPHLVLLFLFERGCGGTFLRSDGLLQYFMQ